MVPTSTARSNSSWIHRITGWLAVEVIYNLRNPAGAAGVAGPEALVGWIAGQQDGNAAEIGRDVMHVRRHQGDDVPGKVALAAVPFQGRFDGRAGLAHAT
jgi:hypothetical protein